MGNSIYREWTGNMAIIIQNQAEKVELFYSGLGYFRFSFRSWRLYRSLSGGSWKATISYSILFPVCLCDNRNANDVYYMELNIIVCAYQDRE